MENDKMDGKDADDISNIIQQPHTKTLGLYDSKSDYAYSLGLFWE